MLCSRQPLWAKECPLAQTVVRANPGVSDSDLLNIIVLLSYIKEPVASIGLRVKRSYTFGPLVNPMSLSNTWLKEITFIGRR